MSKAKKNNSRSYKEALKAQNAFKSVAKTELTKPSEKSEKNASFTLPIPEIKRDLVKNGVFVVVAIAILVALKITNFGYTQLTSLISL